MKMTDEYAPIVGPSDNIPTPPPLPNVVIATRNYRKWGYVVRTEKVDGAAYGMNDFNMKIAYTPSGDYIGNPKDAHHLCAKRGIRPEKRTPTSNVCSIGFNETEQKWYGWSHRAICGFGVGDVVEEGDCAAETLPAGFTAKTLKDARAIACAFAECVS
jgi:hypothetical protein